MGGFEEAIGLGVTIALVDAFSEAGEHIVEKMKEVEHTIKGGAHVVKESLEMMESGMKLVGFGAALLAPLVIAGHLASEAADHMEILRESVTTLAGDSGDLAGELEDIAEHSGLFKRDELLDAGKQLQGMGTTAERIPGMLEAAAKAAAVLHESVGSVSQSFETLQFAMESGMNPTRALRRFGITLPELLAHGIRASKGKVQSSLDEVMDVVKTIIDERFGERAEELAKSLPALQTQIGETFRKGMEAAGGAGLEETERKIVSGFLEVLKAGAPELGEAFGRGLTAFYDLLSPIGRGLKELAIDLVDFLKNHPQIVSAATALAGIGGAALVAAGAVVALGGVIKILPIVIRLVQTSLVSAFEAGAAAIATALPVVLGLAAIAAVIYSAWQHNLGGIRDTLTHWYESARLVVEGVVALFSGAGGEIPAELQQKLVEAGLWPIVDKIYVWGERIADVFHGVWAGISDTFTFVAMTVFQPLGLVLGLVASAVSWLIDQWNELTGVSDNSIAGTQAASDAFQTLGYVIGVVVGSVAVVRGALLAYRAGVAVATAAQWLWNAAMTANPIGLIVVGVAALIGVVALLVHYWDSIALAAMKAWRWMKAALGMDTTEIDAKIAKAEDEIAANKAQAEETKKAAESGSPGTPGEAGAPGPVTERDHQVVFAGSGGAGGAAPSGPAPTGGRAQPLQITNVIQLDGKEIHRAMVQHDAAIVEREHGE